MTRIIAGDWKGRALQVPPSNTRPTSSRVREAIFSSIAHQLDSFDGINVLDVYAGSGALGFESLSRGGTRATFIDSDAKACACIEHNAKQLGTTVSILQRDAMATVANTADVAYDLVFIDPPYAVTDDEVATLVANLASNGWLSKDALIVVERSRNSNFQWPHSVTALSNKSYGDTSIWYGLHTPDRVELS